MEDSQVLSFFTNQTIFLTGGSGFLGKLFIEKLLRESQQIQKIYVLLRLKKNKTSKQRFKELFDYPCFDLLKSKNPDSLKKVSLIIGDCLKPRLGLDDQDIALLTKETTCVIHAAANVKFDQSLKEATSNVRATRDVLELSKQMSNLKVFVFISTAYSNCIHPHIEEQFYVPPLKADQLFSFVDALDDATLQSITPQLLGKWPNTYVYTKSIAEDLLKSVSDELPITIVRPAIIIGTASQPMPGWIDNFYGVVGISVGAALGVLRSVNAKLDARAPLVPADYVCNCTLVAASKRRNFSTTTIYNFVGHNDAQITWREFMNIQRRVLWNSYTAKAIWYYTFTLRENRLWHKTCVFFYHTVPAYIVDFVLFCVGKPTLAVKSYKKLNKLIDLLSYFSTRVWNFDNNNVIQLWNDMNDKDKQIFSFNMEKMDWERYLYENGLGARVHLLKDPLETIPYGVKKSKILFLVHYATLALVYYLIYKFVSFILGLFF